MITLLEAVDCVREARAIASGLRLDEVEAMLRELAEAEIKAGLDLDHRPRPYRPPNKSHKRRMSP